MTQTPPGERALSPWTDRFGRFSMRALQVLLVVALGLVALQAVSILRLVVIPIVLALLLAAALAPLVTLLRHRLHFSHALAAAASMLAALLVLGGVLALVTLQVAAELGLEVPGRLSVVGFNDIPESAVADPALTTVQQPIRRMGREAAEMLLALISGDELPDRHRTLATSFRLRASTAPPEQAS